MKHGEDRLRLSGQRVKEEDRIKEDRDCGTLCGQNVSSAAFATVTGRPPYTAGKVLVLPFMGCVLISFMCFPSRGSEPCWDESGVRRIPLDDKKLLEQQIVALG